ncbi:MAG: hypothetical protein ABR587_16625 [Candidatus Binatia bacterium]
MPPDPPVESLTEPTDNIERLAKYAKIAEKDDFREKACKRADFLKVVHKEIENVVNPPYTFLTAEEAAFVEGWIYATEKEYISEDGTVDDGKLVDAIRRHVPDDDKLVTMTG